MAWEAAAIASPATWPKKIDLKSYNSNHQRFVHIFHYCLPDLDIMLDSERRCDSKRINKKTVQTFLFSFDFSAKACGEYNHLDAQMKRMGAYGGIRVHTDA